MDEKEKILKSDLEELSKKFPAIWSKVYYMSLSHTFSINLPAFSQHDVPMINEFCDKHDLTWVVMQEPSEGQRGVSIKFYNKK